jgi:hypothetical protein
MARAPEGRNPLRRSPRTRCPLALAGLLAGIALVGAGCGDPDEDSTSEPSEPSAAESWAADVCTTLGAWTATIADARTTLSKPRELSPADIEATFHSVASSTSTMVDKLADLGAPDTEAGDEAEKLIKSLSEQLREQAEVVADASDSEPSGAEQRLSRISTVSGSVAKMIEDAKEAVTDIRALDGAKELEDAFKSTSSCQDLSG